MSRGVSERPTELPDKYERLFPWRLDRRCAVARSVAADLAELWQDLGGVETLSVQRRWLCERVVHIHRRVIAYETAVMEQESCIAAGTEPPKLPMDAGTYSNFANVLQGYLRTLGLERCAKPVRSRRELMSPVTPIKPAEASQ
jgi:hypothetical protein